MHGFYMTADNWNMLDLLENNLICVTYFAVNFYVEYN